MCWQLVQIYWRRFAPPGARERKLAEALKDWCLEACAPYEGVAIHDFTSSWRDGIVLNLMIKSFDSSLVNLNEVRQLRGDERLENALYLAKKHLKVPKLIQPKEFASEHLDMKGLVTYLMTLYLAMVAVSVPTPAPPLLPPQQPQELPQESEKRAPKKHSAPLLMKMAPSVSTERIQPAPARQRQPPAQEPTQAPSQLPVAVQFFDFSSQQQQSDIAAPSHTQAVETIASRSRKSSSSSQRSSRARKQEEVLKEYEACLEQVLTWLLEAEQELDSIATDESQHEQSIIDHLSSLRRQFRQHETFMKSLTDSQVSVGRVLHRGNQLVQKLADSQPSNSSAIVAKLAMISERWETIRMRATERQTALQKQLDELQKGQISEVLGWMDQFEALIQDISPLSDDPEACRKQTAEHTQIQEHIEEKQPYIQQLASFIAVVDPATGVSSYSQLESLLKAVGDSVSRFGWSTICQWAEQRSKDLDGLAQLLEHYHSAFGHLSEWLNKRKSELSLLTAPAQLAGDRAETKIAEQTEFLSRMERSLESEHSSFVQLSQFCSELVERFQHDRVREGETSVSERLRSQLDEVTRTWDEIISRLEQHSQALVNLKAGREAAATSEVKVDEETDDSEERKKARLDVSAAESPPSQESRNGEHRVVAEFVRNVTAIEKDVEPLLEWARQFSTHVEQGGGGIRQMVQTCQKKLQEIKELEPKVTRLQIELEKIHAGGKMDSKQLHTVNSTFDRFMRNWSRVVGRISEALNSLSHSREGKKGERSEVEDQAVAIVRRLSEWLKSAGRVLDELERGVQMEPRGVTKRLAQIVEQLNEHQQHLNYLKVLGRDEGIADDKRTMHQQRIDKLEQSFFDLLARIDQIRSRTAQSPPIVPATVAAMQTQRPSTSEEEEESSAPSAPTSDSSPTGIAQRKSAKWSREEADQSKGLIISSPEPSLREAESLRRRLEMEAREEDGRGEDKQGDAKGSWAEEQEANLRKLSTTPGDVEALKAKMKELDTLVAEIHAKQRGDAVDTASSSVPLVSLKSELDALLLLVEIKRELIADNISRTEMALHKFVKAEEIADKQKMVLDSLTKSDDTNLWELERKLEGLHNTLVGENASKAEAIRLLEEVAQMAINSADARKSSRERAVANMHKRVSKLETQWKELAAEIDEHITGLKKERRKRAEALLHKQLELMAQVKEVVKSSQSATDAEELSEYLDNLERLLENLAGMDREAEIDGNWALLGEMAALPSSPSGKNAVGQQWDQLLRTREMVLPLAKEKCDRLRSAIGKCDYFEQALCNCQSWTDHMHHLLKMRIASDINAPEVSSEYKEAFASGTLITQMDKEFGEYDNLVRELADFIESNRGQWSSSDRLSLQLEHAKNQLSELRVKYNEFKEPILLGQRMERARMELAELETALDDLTGIQAENCEYCLIQSRRYKEQLNSLTDDCASLESSKDSLVRGTILNEEQAGEVAQSINALSEKCKQLLEMACSTIHRLERCVDLLKKLRREEEEWERALEQAEQDFVTLIAHRSSPTEGASKNAEKLRTILAGVQESAARVKELEEILKQNSIHFSDRRAAECDERGKRVTNLKRQLSVWIDNASEDDSCILPANFDNQYDELKSKLQAKDINRSEKLNLLSPARAQLEDTANELLKRGEEWAMILSPKLAEISSLWRSVAEKVGAEEPSSAALTLKSSLALPLEEGNFGGDVETLISDFRAAHAHLDFTRYPVVGGVEGWEARVRALTKWTSENKFKMDELLTVGKRVAESGRMELETQSSLAKLDDLIQSVHKIDCDLEAHENALQAVKPKIETFRERASNLRETLKHLQAEAQGLGVDERRSADAKAILQGSVARDITLHQERLMEAGGELRLLHLAGEDLLKTVPSTSTGGSVPSFDFFFPDEQASLNELNERMRLIEVRVQDALVKAIESQQEETKMGVAARAKPVAVDAISVASSGTLGLSLAMEVNETTATDEEGEEELGAVRETAEATTLLPLPSFASAAMDQEQQYTLEQFYVNLDTMEEYLEQHLSEHLPFEGIEERREIMRDFETELQRGEQLVMAQQMTMDITESEHVLQRIAAVRRQLNARESAFNEQSDTLSTMEAIFEKCNLLMANLGQNWQQTQRRKSSPTAQRDKSPELEELEAAQLELEDQLPSIAVILQQCANRFAANAARLSADSRERFQARLAELQGDFQLYSNAIRERRKSVEERLADQTLLKKQMELLEFWCDELDANLSEAMPTIWSPPEINAQCGKFEAISRNDMAEKLDTIRTLEALKDRFVAMTTVESEAKHEVRRAVTQLSKRVSDLKMRLNDRVRELHAMGEEAADFWSRVSCVEAWIAFAKNELASTTEAKIYTPSLANVDRLANEADAMAESVDGLGIIANSSPAGDFGAEKDAQEKVLSLVEEFKRVVHRAHHILESSDTDEHTTTDGLMALSRDGVADDPARVDELYSRIDSAKRRLDEKSPAAELGGDDETPVGGGMAMRCYRNEPNEQDDVSTALLPRRKISVAEQGRLDTVTRLRSWLQEVEREASATVDLCDQNIIRQAVNRVQNLVDELNVHEEEIRRLEVEARDRLVVERTRLARIERERMLTLCAARRADLQRILERSRVWDQRRSAIEAWLSEASERLHEGGKISELGDKALQQQTGLLGEIHAQIAAQRDEVERFNAKSNELLDEHRRDDGHNISHMTSRLNTEWAKFNDGLRVRQAMLEATEKARHDFHTSLLHFEAWLKAQCGRMAQLESETDNTQRLKNTSKRKDWMAEEREIRLEMDAHHDVMASLRQMGRSLVSEQESSAENEEMRQRMDKLEADWLSLCTNSSIVRERLESAQEEQESIMRDLADLLHWTEKQVKTIVQSQPVGGDLATIQKQSNIAKAIEKTVEAREKRVQNVIHSAHSYLHQHDLRPPMHTPSVLLPAADETPLTESQREERRVGAQILADCEKLASDWGTLKQRMHSWSGVVAAAHGEMQELDRAIAESLLSVGSIEDELQQLPSVELLKLEELKEARTENAELRRHVHEAGVRIDDVNDLMGQIAAQNIVMSGHLESQIQAINQRYEKLKRDVGCRGAALERAFQDFGPSSEHFLVDSVQPPWQRAISSANQLPYYIDHNTENTQWDHPQMVDVLEEISLFNQVKFAAYRTAMKLRAIQKRLCLDLIELPELEESFGMRLKGYQSPLEDQLKVEDAVLSLLPLFELAAERYPNLVKNVPLAVDLALNFILNIYDPSV